MVSSWASSTHWCATLVTSTLKAPATPILQLRFHGLCDSTRPGEHVNLMLTNPNSCRIVFAAENAGICHGLHMLLKAQQSSSESAAPPPP